MDQRFAVTLSPRGALFASNSTDNGATVKATRAEALALAATGNATLTARAIAVSPATVWDGGTAEVFGLKFGTPAGTVTLGAVAQTVTSWNANNIRFTVVKGALAIPGTYPVVVTPNAGGPLPAVTGISLANPPPPPGTLLLAIGALLATGELEPPPAESPPAGQAQTLPPTPIPHPPSEKPRWTS